MRQSIDITSYGQDFCEIRLHDGVSPGCERMSGNPERIATMVFQRMKTLGIPHDAPVFMEGKEIAKTIGEYLGLSEARMFALQFFSNPENQRSIMESLESAENMIRQLEKERAVTYDMLHTPTTV